MIITADIIRRFDPCDDILTQKFSEKFPNGLDISRLWGDKDERKTIWQEALADEFLKRQIGWAIAGGLIPARVIGDFSGANLTEADLRGADLSDANLSWANLIGADLRVANLTEADLRVANLFRADLRGANLTEADLRVANLTEADLRVANLFKADLRGANLTEADFREAIKIFNPQERM